MSHAQLDPQNISLMYGTAWKEEDTAAYTQQAIRCGFRAIDTANQRKHYYEAGVGEAIQASIGAGICQRKDLFLQSKYTYKAGQDHRLPYDPAAPLPTQVEQSFTQSLLNLHTNYLDSYVLHGPLHPNEFGPEDQSVWKAMEELKRAQKTRFLGVSNVTAKQLKTLLETASIPPAFVQNRCYATTGWDHEVRAICQQANIRYQGFSLLTANRQILSHPDFLTLTINTGCTGPQLIFAFAKHLNMLPLIGSTQIKHLQEDQAAMGLTLHAEHVARLERIAL
jgi:diketogulonate reductase-like aldo/keto reductase